MPTTQRPTALVPGPSTVPMVRPGDKVSAAQQNALISAIKQGAPQLRAPRQIDETNTFTKTRTMEVIEILGDSLMCRDFSNGTADDTQSVIQVARPFGQRR